ncbi:MAG TPA: zinc ribbon domain-containing protein [Blastocatellia bacterium]|nr:zinc ribbon domain-containing protein [Blastocatellia bacterium]
MYCPRCGAQNIDTTKFCRQCGLPLAQITGYVSTGGTGALQQPPSFSAPPPFQFTETAEMLALKQKKIMTILSICIAPIIIAIIGDWLNVDEFAAIPFLLIPLGIAWAVFRYKTQLRLLQEKQLQQFYAQQQHHPPIPNQAPAPSFNFQPSSNQPPSGQPQLSAPRTNPLAEQSRGSVIEDETRKFPEPRR